ncbi:MAG: nucleotidyltransferase domain-containing protein [Calditrichaeota bacterium]|nr:MAG: nucleotidyltransferase domain-containing protein [Calditrichota bacterium]
MREKTKNALVQAIKNHPAVVKAAITGSLARQTDADRFSDLDVLLVARDIKAVSDVRAWFPAQVLICAFHLSNYCTVLLDDFQKIDIAIYSIYDSPSQWVVHDYEVIKNGEDFEVQLANAAKSTREKMAAHLNPDVSLDNILLLLVTASHRNARGELLSAHDLLCMACDMVIALEIRQHGFDSNSDLLDPRRRLERLRPKLAATIHECLFATPGDGIPRLVQYLAKVHRSGLTEAQMKVLDYLLETTD